MDLLADLVRNCAQVLSPEELRKKLAENRPLRVKLGVDPTAPDIHLGHTVGLTKLRQFQELGHQAILIIGDFTAMIGDPSGRSATRPQLTHDEVMANAKTYQEQAFKILDPARTRVVFNGEWFEMMSFEEVIRLNSRVTLQQMLQREDFRERMDKGLPVRAHEIQYPIMQGWDSVMIQADVELGGTDQLFNIMVGRDLQREEGQPQQVAMMLPILEGLDGIQKMSKSLGNSVGVSEPPIQMFGKLMSIPDALIAQYLTLLTRMPIAEVRVMLSDTKRGKANPRDVKMRLAREVVTIHHGTEAAKQAEAEFVQVFQKRETPKKTRVVQTNADRIGLIDALVAAKLASSKGDARRLIAQGGVKVDGAAVRDEKTLLALTAKGVLLQKGKHQFVRLVPAH